jgi:hypothetical protein
MRNLISALALSVAALTFAAPHAYFSVQCGPAAPAQYGSVTFYPDGGMALFADGGLIGVYPRPGNLFEEGAIQVTGTDGGAAFCVLSSWLNQ